LGLLLTPLLIRLPFRSANGHREGHRLSRREDEEKILFGALNFGFEVKEN